MCVALTSTHCHTNTNEMGESDQINCLKVVCMHSLNSYFGSKLLTIRPFLMKNGEKVTACHSPTYQLKVILE